MVLARKKLREVILQLLYSTIFSSFEKDYLISFMMKQIKTTKKNILFAFDYVKKMQGYFQKIDEDIQKISTAYELNRISKVELSILRLALFEMIYDKNIPEKVAISEAIRLTKKFASKYSISFVNAILDSIYKKKYENNKK